MIDQESLGYVCRASFFRQR